MWQLSSNVDFNCEKCNFPHSVPSNWLDLEPVSGSDREMGPATYYLGELQIECNECDAHISLQLHLVEYPQGVLNHLSMNSTGATITKVADVEFIAESPILLLQANKIYVPETRLITDLSEIRNTVPQLIKLIQEDMSYIYRISTREFEEVVAEIFRSQGYQVTLTKRTRDGGKDVIAINRDNLGLETCYFIECKRHALDSKVDVSIVREVYGVHATRNGPNKSIIATTSTFTPDAFNFVNNGVRSIWDMQLKDIDDVMNWIRNYKL